jgi:hypothetical protein
VELFADIILPTTDETHTELTVEHKKRVGYNVEESNSDLF